MPVNPDYIIGIALFTAFLGGVRDYGLMAVVASVPVLAGYEGAAADQDRLTLDKGFCHVFAGLVI